MSGGWADSTRYGVRGAVCSVDHLASSAGIAVLRDGGSAADAAVATSAVLAITTQHMCGMGGDLLAVVHPGDGTSARGLLGVGRAGAGSDPDRLRSEGHSRLPLRGDIRTVTVPGCVDGWLALHEAYGRLSLERVLAPAVEYALHGFPISPLLATALPSVAGVVGGEELVGTLPVQPGDLRRRPTLGSALAAIGRDGRDAWYGGDFGRGLISLGGGLFTAADLATVQAEWAVPAQLRIGSRTLLSTPPPTQGYLVLASAYVAEAVGALGVASLDDPHVLVEAARLAGYDRIARLADGVSLDDLLDPGGLDSRVAQVSAERALPLPPPADGGGTIYLCTADSDGMVVSLSQSNASGFGSNLAVAEVGVFVHNRGLGFSLRPGHPAELRPGARPPHTLCPSMVYDDDGAVTAIGTMGGDGQPQILLQLLAALAAGRTPAQALALPRWAFVGPNRDGFDQWEPWPDGAVVPSLAIESHAPQEWPGLLSARGHRVERAAAGVGFGHAHLLVRRSDRSLAAASDPRAGTGDAQCY